MSAALLGVLSATIVEFNKVSPEAAYLMLPYLGWTVFATVLTVDIYRKNPGVSSSLLSSHMLGRITAFGWIFHRSIADPDHNPENTLHCFFRVDLHSCELMAAGMSLNVCRTKHHEDAVQKASTE